MPFEVTERVIILNRITFKRERGVTGALDGGVPMSHVDFKKWQCCMSLSLGNHHVPCRI